MKTRQWISDWRRSGGSCLIVAMASLTWCKAQGSESKKYQDRRTNAPSNQVERQVKSTMSSTECLASAAVHACNPKENNNIKSSTLPHHLTSKQLACRPFARILRGLSVFVSVFVHFRKTLGGPNMILSECTDYNNFNDPGSTLSHTPNKEELQDS